MIFSPHKKNKHVFLDNAAGTPLDKGVFDKMKIYFYDQFYNPGAIYNQGFTIRESIISARKTVADMLSARHQDIIFVDGGTEANNLALRGTISSWRTIHPGQKPHIITSAIEHASILETCADLEKKNIANVSYIQVNEQGVVDIQELKNSLSSNTVIVSIGYVNGETGVIQDIKQIAKTIRHFKKHQKSELPYFHTDAIQAVNYLDINVQKLGVDVMTINASKIYGPKKIAAVYRKSSVNIDPIITGGNQEFGLRAGTENIPSIIGFAESLIVTKKIRTLEYNRLSQLQEYFQNQLTEKIQLDFLVNSFDAERIPNIINISIPEISSEEIVLRLGAFGIQTSVKSACKSGEEGDSHVIRALRDSNTQSIRFSMGRDTRKKDIDYVVSQLVKITDEMMYTYNTYIKK